jgi:hypothetical protein
MGASTIGIITHGGTRFGIKIFSKIILSITTLRITGLSITNAVYKHLCLR